MYGYDITGHTITVLSAAAAAPGAVTAVMPRCVRLSDAAVRASICLDLSELLPPSCPPLCLSVCLSILCALSHK